MSDKISRRFALKASSSVIAGALIGTTDPGEAQKLEEGGSNPVKVVNNSSESNDITIQFVDRHRTDVISDIVKTRGLNDSTQRNKPLAQRVSEAKGWFAKPGRLQPSIDDVSVETGGQSATEIIGIPPSRFTTGFRIEIYISDKQIRIAPT